MKVIEKIKKKKPLLANIASLQNLIPKTIDGSSPKKQKTAPMSKRRKRFEEEYVIPEPARHEYFDSSISKFFSSIDTGSEITQLLKKPENTTEKVNNIILENIYRMFGITAFPVSDPSKKVKRDLLGVRIEIFNESLLKFETPHYIIFEQNSKTGKWMIFKHTIPVFIQIYEIAKEYDELSDIDQLFQFLQNIRKILNKTSLKHQVVESIRQNFDSKVTNIEKDIALDILKFRLNVSDVSTTVILNISLDSIQSCFIESGFSESEKFRIGNVLKGDIKTFEKRLHDVIQSLEYS